MEKKTICRKTTAHKTDLLLWKLWGRDYLMVEAYAYASTGKCVERVSNQQVQRQQRHRSSKWNAKLDPGYSGQPISLAM